MRSAPTLKSWMTPFSSVAMLEKLALLRMAFCSAPVLRSASWRLTSVTFRSSRTRLWRAFLTEGGLAAGRGELFPIAVIASFFSALAEPCPSGGDSAGGVQTRSPEGDLAKGHATHVPSAVDQKKLALSLVWCYS